jgi:hypothetical protein
LDPIFDVRPLVDEQLIIFANYYGLIAYDSVGEMWRVRPPVDDDLVISHIHAGVMHCTGWDAAEDATVLLDVDVKTGRVISRRES